MKRPRLRVLFCLVVALCVPAGVIAAQDRGSLSSLPSITSDAYLTQNNSLHTALLSNQAQLESIGNQISGPDQVLLLAAASSDQHTVQLPGVPTTLYMALCGFICFTAVRDRRSWLTVLAGAMWLCQAGIAALPELGQLCRSNSTLAISLSNFEQPRAVCGSFIGKPQNINTQAMVNYFIEPALTLKYSVRPTEDFLVFSHAFIFSTIARGPPARVLENV